ncbi:hypothetical protein LEP1GSC083_0980 [Leptospira interrogans serovar Pyrogenes str. L0374]|uniref:Ankyrin repeat protein n=2 Tax=Leptospira interrogans TaxID=173 RepID=A0AAP9WA15_LEPIR|nr:hypothetical protein LEP1GSC077_3345 [Leptospira interrogans str. C10069]EKO88529.1 hypothetical protein LEP1GSC009_1143 [Leptospira interrogans serovar Grippotyphosa str. Andaman]EKP84120.1 hypothetical protein LEP1GSC020_4337 [Leptospira interrogans serovar Grippotyphosa str. 2006006986]EMN31535.1 hypothetical protein LEP1GSC083_0980 [Leptospira interrogans serovar Pyrogenes str. L0374]EMN63466.1 hypothetical protein LEP1GSC092_1346 [Leptospira interrogans serovar Pyrogenes str. R168]KAA1
MQEVLEQESLLILSIKDAKNEDTSIESFRVLLKYGADMDLGDMMKMEKNIYIILLMFLQGAISSRR